MVFMASVNGTSKTMALKRSGLRFTDADTSRPPLLSPQAASRDFSAMPKETRLSAAAMKS
eukprot:CAMPEP_0115052072 /NCGR_PEP_ID=MMETSP0227-20121206/2714_1 /TAXON_ID=89957 /ORGANISM="Polarella glacialis, Strain CCMP 1383" /LENGTH=59 /DNA_ID=CAMNT_0002436153 /DNA_START=390 /DNA_END=569 /DNA_ORIENTATION=-